ncbi:MAG: TolC family protein [Planctomycetaceae bacterium]
MGEAGNGHYKGHATAVEFPNVCQTTPEVVQCSLEPHTVREQEHYEVRQVSLQEAILTALQNAQVVRTNAQFLAGGGLLDNPNNVASVYDPAIQESGVLFGGRGVEAALAEFDTQFTSSLTWGRSENFSNSALARVVDNETANFDASLRKVFANGSQVSISHEVNYLGTDVPGTPFPSSYAGNLSAQYRQPLLAGAGTEYTRIAGPIANSFGGISGVSQGVVISRINNDITIAQFEGALHDLVRDVEAAYWDLYVSYRRFDIAATSRDATQSIWQDSSVRARPEINDIDPAAFAQAEDQLFATRAQMVDARSQLFTQETRLRRLMGLPVNDGTILQPSDEPITAEVIPDWFSGVTEALSRRVELRQQKWNIRSLELQLSAAKSLTKPRLDFVAGYQRNGFGDQLFPYDTQDPGTPPGFRSMYGRMANGDEDSWSTGLQLNVPIGFRLAHAQVRNIELRLAKARKVLAEQEKEIAQELAVAHQEVSRAYRNAQENYNRLLAARESERVSRIQLGDVVEADVALRSVLRRADAENAYFGSVTEYNKALADLEYRKGLILAHNSVHVREGAWTGGAYEDAARRSESRAHAHSTPLKSTEPPEFVTHGPVGEISFQSEAAAAALGGYGVIEHYPVEQSPPAAEPKAEPQPREDYAPGVTPGTKQTNLPPGPSDRTSAGGGPTFDDLNQAPLLDGDGKALQPVGWWRQR